MRHAPRVGGLRHILLAGDLFAGRHVEKAELGLEPAVAGALRTSGQHELRVDGLVGGEIGRLVGRSGFRAGVDRVQKYRTLEIIARHRGDCARGLVAREGRDGDVYRLKASALEVDDASRARGRERRESGARDEARCGAAGDVACHAGRLIVRERNAGTN